MHSQCNPKSHRRYKPSNNSTATCNSEEICNGVFTLCWFSFFKSVDSNKIIQLMPWYFKRSFLHLLNLWCHLVWLLYKHPHVFPLAACWEDISVNNWKMFLSSFPKFLLHFLTPWSPLKTKQSKNLSLLVCQDQPRLIAFSLFFVCLHSSFVSGLIFRLWALWDRGCLFLIHVQCRVLK